MTKTDYDVIIIGAGPGGIFSAYEMATKNPNIKSAFLRQALSFQSANVRLTATRLSPASSAKPAL